MKTFRRRCSRIARRIVCVMRHKTCVRIGRVQHSPTWCERRRRRIHVLHSNWTNRKNENKTCGYTADRLHVHMTHARKRVLVSNFGGRMSCSCRRANDLALCCCRLSSRWRLDTFKNRENVLCFVCVCVCVSFFALSLRHIERSYYTIRRVYIYRN